MNSHVRLIYVDVGQIWKMTRYSDDAVQVQPQELEVWSSYLLFSLITKSARCHYVVMTRSETKIQAPRIAVTRKSWRKLFI